MSPEKETFTLLRSSTETIGKVALLIIFGVVGLQKILAIYTLVAQSSAVPLLDRGIHLAAQFCALSFIILLIIFTTYRHSPTQSARGIEARVSAAAGTFLACALGVLPPAELSFSIGVAALILFGLGTLLSAYVLLWLGRSFSLTAQARELVTCGPYALVRHPLYLCEEVTVLALMILFFSPAAVLITVVHGLFQLRRMWHEEQVLRHAYAEYAVYASRTPMLVPRFATKAAA